MSCEFIQGHALNLQRILPLSVTKSPSCCGVAMLLQRQPNFT